MELNSKESRNFRLFHFYHVFRAFAGPNEKNIASYSTEFIPIQFHTRSQFIQEKLVKFVENVAKLTKLQKRVLGVLLVSNCGILGMFWGLI